MCSGVQGCMDMGRHCVSGWRCEGCLLCKGEFGCVCVCVGPVRHSFHADL